MERISHIIESLATLEIVSSSWQETTERIDAFGQVSADSLDKIANIFKVFSESGVSAPNLRLDNAPTDQPAVLDLINDGSTFWPSGWSLTFSKERLFADQAQVKKIVFASTVSFHSWASQLTPLHPDALKLRYKTEILVQGLDCTFGGAHLRIAPLRSEAHQDVSSYFVSLPDENAVRKVNHIISNTDLLLSAETIFLSWGDRDHAAAAPFKRLAYAVMALALAQDVYCTEGDIFVAIRGIRKVTLPLLSNPAETVSSGQLDKLADATNWVYQERTETRLQLLVDRLTLDMAPTNSLVSNLTEHLDLALRQAEDSYAFVIIDRKDAYYKEMRELMKDMKAQSDHYATKTRDMVTALLRDFLGVLVFIAFAFIGKFDQKQLKEVLDSQELGLFLKFLSCYLAISFFLQVAAVMRDDVLTHREANKWLDVLRNYTSSKDNQDNFQNPIQIRRQTLHYAIIVSAVLYGMLVISIWSLPNIVHLLL